MKQNNKPFSLLMRLAQTTCCFGLLIFLLPCKPKAQCQAIGNSLGGSGTFCLGDQINVGIPLTEADQVYVWMLNGKAVYGPKDGNGSNLSFQTSFTPSLSGNYKVITYKKDNPCDTVTFGNVTVTYGGPPLHNIIKTNYCGEVTGAPIIMDGSDVGITYQLYNDNDQPVGSPLAGTGGQLNFGTVNETGWFSVKASAGSCIDVIVAAIYLGGSMQPPFVFGFNNATSDIAANCWQQKFVSGNFSLQASTSNPSITPYEGSRFAYWNAASSAAGNETRLVSPLITTGNIIKTGIEFYWYNSNIPAHSTGNYLNEGVQVQYSLDGNTWVDIGSFIPRHDPSLTAGTGQWKKKIGLFPDAINNTYSPFYLAFKFHSEKGEDMGLDAVGIGPISGCSLISGFKVSTTSTSFNLSWDAIPDVVNYEYAVTTSSTPPASGTTTLNNNATVGSLNPATRYYIHIRSQCNAGLIKWQTYNYTTQPACELATPVTTGASVTTTIPPGPGAWVFDTYYPNSSAGIYASGKEQLYTFTPSVTGVYYINVTSATGGAAAYLYKPVSLGCTVAGWLGAGNTSTPGVIVIDMLTAGTPYFILVKNGDGNTSITQKFTIERALVGDPSSFNNCNYRISPNYINKNSPKTEYILDENNRLIAGINYNKVTSTDYIYLTASQYVHTGAIRRDAGNHEYLDRNFSIGDFSNYGDTLSITLFFTNTELQKLINEPNDGVGDVATIDDLSIAAADGQCTESLDNVTSTTINPVRTGAYDAASSFIEFKTPNLGSYFLQGGGCGPAPTITTAGGQTSFCQGGSLVLTSSSTQYNQWYKDGNAINGATNSTYTATGAGRYTVTISKPNGCVLTSQETVIAVTSKPAAAVVTAAGPVSFCAGGSVQLNSDAASGNQWYKDAVAINGATGQSYAATNAGTYTVIVSNGGCSSALSNAIVVSIVPPPTATISYTGNASFCQGGSLTLNANTGTDLSYQWYKDAAAVNGATNATYSANAAGRYTVQVTNSSNCSLVSSPVDIIINPLPPATITAAGSTTLCTGGNVVLNANTGSGLSYQWYKNGQAINGAVNTSYTATDSGSFTVQVTNSNTCQSLSAITKVIIVDITTPPVITASGSTSLCAGASVVLKSSAATGNKWYRDGNLLTASVSDTCIATVAGVYTVAYSNGSCSSPISAGITVTINALPSATISYTGNASFCEGGSIMLNANTGTGLSYQWYKDAGVINGAVNATHTAVSSGRYTVKVTNSNNCSAISSPVDITVNPLPTATITAAGSTTLCTGSNVVLNANTGTGLTYQWYKNGQAINGAVNAGYTATDSGSYTVQITNSNNCQAVSAITKVTIVDITTPPVITASGSTAFCEGGSVILTSSAGSGNKWYRDGNLLAGSTADTCIARVPGIYTVVYSNGSCTSPVSAGLTVTVNVLPAATITAGGPLTFCDKQSVTLTANAGAGLSYQWYRNDTAINGSTSQSMTATVGAGYSVRVTNSNQCAVTSAKTTVVVTPLPAATISFNGSANLCPGNTVTLNGNTGTGLTYQWVKDAVDIPSATTASYVASAAGNYTVRVTNSNNCSAVSTATVVTIVAVTPPPVITAFGITSFCDGGSVQLTSNASSGNQWYKNGAPIAGATDRTYSAATAGSYTVAAGSASSCSSNISNAINVTVYPKPNGSLSHPAQTIICEGTPVKLTASGATSYQWYYNNVLIANATSADYTATATGIYKPAFVSDKGCTVIANDSVVLKPIAKPTAAFDFDTYCVGTPVHFINKSVAAAGNTISFNWQFGNNTGSTVTDPVVTYTATGNYQVRLIAISNQCTTSADTVTKAINVQLPIAGISYPPVGANINMPVTLHARDIGTAYQWSPSAGLDNSQSKSPVLTPTADQLYRVQITTPSGCITVDTQMVSIVKKKDIYVPKGFTPDNNNNNDVLYAIPIGIKEFKYFKVYNRWGNLVFETNDPSPAKGWNGKLNGIDQPAGTYTWIAVGIDTDGQTIKRSGTVLLLR